MSYYEAVEILISPLFFHVSEPQFIIALSPFEGSFKQYQGRRSNETVGVLFVYSEFRPVRHCCSSLLLYSVHPVWWWQLSRPEHTSYPMKATAVNSPVKAHCTGYSSRFWKVRAVLLVSASVIANQWNNNDFYSLSVNLSAACMKEIERKFALLDI